MYNTNVKRISQLVSLNLKSSMKYNTMKAVLGETLFTNYNCIKIQSSRFSILYLDFVHYIFYYLRERAKQPRGHK